MKISYDKNIIKKYLDLYPIEELFDTNPLPFVIIHYEEGETIINPLNETNYLQFIVEGSIKIYALTKEGDMRTLTSSQELTLLGDLEFVTHKKPAFFSDALTPVTAICLSFKDNEERLSQDLRFHKTLLMSLSKKIEYASLSEIDYDTLDHKLLRYMQTHDNQLISVEIAADALRCSRRQMHRIINQLIIEKKIIRLKKGHYQIL